MKRNRDWYSDPANVGSVPGWKPVRPHDRALLIAHAQWHLTEAERLDHLARHPPPKPPPVASVKDMTQQWIEATASPALLRQTADTHRAAARRIHDRLAQEATDR